jgi:hypothetical protein
MEHALLTLAMLISTADARTDGDRVTVRAMNQRLQLTGWQATWDTKGEIQPPVYPIPGGRMIALLKHGDTGERNLVLWSKEGHEIAKTKLALTGEVLGSRVFDKRLTMTTASEVAEFDTAALHPGRVRKLVVSVGRNTKYLPSPTGVWVVDDQTLSYFDLDGRAPLQKKRPLATASNKPPCPEVLANVRAACTVGFQPEKAEMLVSDVGELLMLDVFKELYPVEPIAWSLPDQVWPSVTTILDSNGSVVAQKVSSWMTKTREWFWSTRGDSQNPTPFAAHSGLVRGRHTTQYGPPGNVFGSRARDFLSWSFDDDDLTVHRWSPDLKPIWNRRVGGRIGEGFTFSPSWISPMLLHDHGCYRFAVVSEQRTACASAEFLIDEIYREQLRTRFQRPRFAIGQSTEGDWLLIAY